MQSLILSPSIVEDYEWIFFDPAKKSWISPILSFDIDILNPYSQEVQRLNYDIRYQTRTIDYFNTILTEKWLHKKSFYEKLLPYFEVSRNDKKVDVKLIEDISKLSDPSAFQSNDHKFILKFIEKYFITRRFVEKCIKSYVHSYKCTWYDLYENGDSVKKYIRHKLKKVIIKTIHSLSKKEK